MIVTAGAWLITIGLLAAVFVVDLLVIGRRPHEPSMRESGIAKAVFSRLAVVPYWKSTTGPPFNERRHAPW